jgi:hypothetical protein
MSGIGLYNTLPCGIASPLQAAHCIPAPRFPLVQGLGFRVWGCGSGFRVQGCGLRDLGSGLRAWGSGFGVEASVLRIKDQGFAEGLGFRVWGSGLRVQV